MRPWIVSILAHFNAIADFMKKIYPVCNSSTHTSDHDDTASIPEPDHLFRYGLCCHENSRDVDCKHFASFSLACAYMTCSTAPISLPNHEGTLIDSLRISSRILQSRRLLLNPRRSNQPIHPAMLISNPLHNLIQPCRIHNIDPPIFERGFQFLCSSFLYSWKIWRWSF